VKSDPLADVPPGEFVAKRNALVKELRAAGKTAEARAIARRRRPAPSVWAVNHLARTQPELVGDLVAAGKALAGAQRAILKGGGVDKMRDAEAALREALGAVEKELQTLSGAALRRAMDTLRAAATADDATRAALRGGQLEEDLDAGTGFEALGAVRLPPRPKKKPPPAAKKPSAAEERARARKEKQLAKLRAEAEAAERRARELRERLDEAAAAHGA
jgi:hypothetical protein